MPDGNSNAFDTHGHDLVLRRHHDGVPPGSGEIVYTDFRGMEIEHQICRLPTMPNGIVTTRRAARKATMPKGGDEVRRTSAMPACGARSARAIPRHSCQQEPHAAPIRQRGKDKAGADKP